MTFVAPITRGLQMQDITRIKRLNQNGKIKHLPKNTVIVEMSPEHFTAKSIGLQSDRVTSKKHHDTIEIAFYQILRFYILQGISMSRVAATSIFLY